MSLAVTFTELVNSSFKCKRFPNVMKHTEILPFLKQKDDLINNFGCYAFALLHLCDILTVREISC